jgi:hypothetical protein
MTDEPEAAKAVNAAADEADDLPVVAEEKPRRIPEYQWWNVAAVIAWIMYRDRSLCDEIAEAGDDVTRIWLSTFSATAAVHRGLPESRHSLKEAEGLLIAELESSRLVALAAPLDEQGNLGARIELPDSEWHLKEFRYEPIRAVPRRVPNQGSNAADKSYGAILLFANAVMSVLSNIIAAERERLVPTVAAAKRATKELTEKLVSNPDMTLDEAMQLCCRKFGVSQRQVQSDVWPNAREKAGLPRKAPPGRKKKR